MQLCRIFLAAACFSLASSLRTAAFRRSLDGPASDLSVLVNVSGPRQGTNWWSYKVGELFANLGEASIGFINSQIQDHPVMALGLLRSKVFSDALIRYLQDSSFLEEMLLRADLLTQGLCGYQAQSHMYLGMKGARKDLKNWGLRIKGFDCGEACQEQLSAEVSKRRSWLRLADANSSVASDFIDMEDLLQRDTPRGKMASVFLRELAQSPGLLRGLTPERMADSFGQMTIRAQPEAWYAKKNIKIQVRSMRYKTGTPPEPWANMEQPPDQESQWLTSQIDNIAGTRLGPVLDAFIQRTLAGFTEALVSESVMLDPAFPDVLNAALAPLKMDMWLVAFKVGYASASGDIQFLTEKQGSERDLSFCKSR